MNPKEFERERRRQIKMLIKASTPEQRKLIKKGQRAGRKLRRELEALEQDE